MTKLNYSGKPLHQRPGEQVGAGWFVFRRGAYANRIKPGALPFEHPTVESALEEKDRLEKLFPDCKFSIFAEVDAPDWDGKTVGTQE